MILIDSNIFMYAAGSEHPHKEPSVTADVMDLTRDLLDRYQGLSARDALHAAVTLSHGAQAICSYDGDFDQIEDLRRIEP